MDQSKQAASPKQYWRLKKNQKNIGKHVASKHSQPDNLISFFLISFYFEE